MVAFSKFVLPPALIAGSFASPLNTPKGASTLAVFHELKQLPHLWASEGKVHEPVTVRAQIGLKQGNIQGLQAKLLDVSDPDSPNYGKWLSREEVAKYTAPAPEHIAAVKKWLNANGIVHTSQPTNDWIEFTAPVATMEALLGTTYEWYSHDGKKPVPRTMKYSVPEHLHSAIELIAPTTAFHSNVSPEISEHNSTAAQGAAGASSAAGYCSNGVTPDCIKANYNVDYKSTGSQTVASSLMINLAANHNDYGRFGQTYASSLRDFQEVRVQGGYNAGQGNNEQLLEGNLDTQYVGGVSAPSKNQLLVLGPNGSSNQNFMDELAGLSSYLTSNPNPPSSVSTSYGGAELAYDQSYMNRICNEFMKAGSQGISIFFSSGDYGVADNNNRCNNGFVTLFPASCPWSTAVGGTQYSNGREVVADFSPKLTSPGGGFSDVFSAPSYNAAVTKAYINNNLDSSYDGYYNPSGRGLPDVSLQSLQFNVFINGQDTYVRGTSAAAPSWAGLVGLLNDYRHSQGKPNLGFINPLLYKNPQVMRDITSGNNYGCGTNGYYAASGWDPTTGLGSVDFAKLRKLL